MTTWFITRHPGAIRWAERRGIVNHDAARSEQRVADSISPADVAPGDIVIGTLPVHLAAELCARGARYFHISMTVPTEWRGKELTSDDMDNFGATCREFVIIGRADGREAEQTPGIPTQGQGIHVCIVSDQHMANLLPILKRRPSRVELVCTPEMLQPGRGLEKIARALQLYGYDSAKTTTHTAPASCATDFHAARQFARDLRETLGQIHPDEPLALNATGGTKALSSAFFLEFQGAEILYTDTEGGRVQHMESAVREAEPLGSLIPSMDDYLHCQGYCVTRSTSSAPGWQETAKRRRPITEMLVQLLSGTDKNMFGKFVGEFNLRAQQIEDVVLRNNIKGNPRLVAPAQRTAILQEHVPATDIPELMLPMQTLKKVKKLVAAGLLGQRAENGPYFFPSLDALRYLGGGWLEEWAWLVATSCGAEECRAGVFIQAMEASGGTGKKDDNELDLVILHHNRLLIAECKTINWQGANAKQEILNKLDALGNHARGLFGRSLLVSARPLDDDARRRARAYGVSVIEADGLPRLKEEIRNWMNAGETR